MRNSHSLSSDTCQRYSYIRRYDLGELDNPDVHSFSRLSYINRLEWIIQLISDTIPPPARVIDWGCAQGNMGLTLAEMGYGVLAADLRHDFLLYSREKYEYGKIDWIVGNIEYNCVRPASSDVVLLCELLEHCAYPEAILAAAASSLRKGGIVVVTTPNGEYVRHHLPNFRSVRDGDRSVLAQRQYGPDGTDHLFLYSAEELQELRPPGMSIHKWGYMGSILLSWRLANCLKMFSEERIKRIVRRLESRKGIARRFSTGLYCVYVKN
jgi:2-polyprenyl-3-methyl-5-hydroxy-6-metoxy-1,4-benzoquinol methylase